LYGCRHRHRLGLFVPDFIPARGVQRLTGERGVLMGALAGIMEAQYEVLRAHGHSPSEAFNERSRN